MHDTFKVGLLAHDGAAGAVRWQIPAHTAWPSSIENQMGMPSASAGFSVFDNTKEFNVSGDPSNANELTAAQVVTSINHS